MLWVGGPGVVHTGAAPAMVAMVDAGFVDVLFAGNALATHDIESSLYGTSLGVDLAHGPRRRARPRAPHPRAQHDPQGRARSRPPSSSGVLTGGIMHALVTHDKEFVLVGSVRDDGPLPDVYTDVIEGQRAMRAQLNDVGFCLMVATMLHSVATGNILPASIPLVCVDINPATVTKLADRGSSQARGIVTDVGLFLEQLAIELVPELPTAIAADRSASRSAHQVGGADRAGLADRAPPPARAGTLRCAAPTSDRPERLARRLEQQVAGGRHPAADDHDVAGRGPRPGWPPRRRASRRPRRTPRARPGRPPRRRGDHRPVSASGLPPQSR